MLYCAVRRTKYEKISTSEITTKILDKMEVTYESTTKEKEARINALVNKYELFKMEENKEAKSMFARFSKITCYLKSSEMIYSNNLQVKSMVRSLPKA